MPFADPNSIESLVRMSRRQLWTAFGIIAALGVCAILILAKVSLAAGNLFAFLPMIIVIAVARSSSFKDAALSDGAMQAIRNDELRQASLARAYRNGFLALLGLQPLLAVILTSISAPNLIALMVCVSVLTGSLAFLGSLLYYDR